MAGKLKAFGFDSELLRETKPQRIVQQNWAAAIADMPVAQKALESALADPIDVLVHPYLESVLKTILHTIVSVQSHEDLHHLRYCVSLDSREADSGVAVFINSQPYSRDSLKELTIKKIVTQEAGKATVLRVILAILAAPYVYPNQTGLMDTLAGMNLYPTPAALYCFCMMNRIPMNIN